MFISTIGTPNSGLNIQAINRSLEQKSEMLYVKKNEKRRDILTLSPNGKKQHMIELLMKQKQDLMKRKEEVAASSAENGTDMKQQLEDYEKQLKTIDEQIAQLQSETQDKKKNDTSVFDKDPKSKEEVQTERLNSIMELSASNEQAEIISSTKNKVDGRVRILKSEVKTGYGNIEAKLDDIASLEHQSRSLSADIGKELQETNGSIVEMNDNVEEETTDLQDEE